THIGNAHIRCDIRALYSLFDYIHTVISICRELNRCASELLLIISNKCLCCLILCIRCKRCQEHQSLCERRVKSLNIKQSVHTVNAEPCRFESCSVSLRKDQGCLLIIDRKEYK